MELRGVGGEFAWLRNSEDVHIKRGLKGDNKRKNAPSTTQ